MKAANHKQSLSCRSNHRKKLRLHPLKISCINNNINRHNLGHSVGHLVQVVTDRLTVMAHHVDMVHRADTVEGRLLGWDLGAWDRRRFVDMDHQEDHRV
jgi:hypothetical protein